MRQVPTESQRILAAHAAGAGGGKPYRISDDGKSITCLGCERTSYHPEDVRHRYCACCKIFHAN